ncbi:chemotaxis response regulator protein-glutamate methylesterase [Candidatus Poribacteria bacterium]|nr:chemotaxis response regulator protein-glutamate methylesterase [Candidatus Poribacteria bacterium]
MSAPAIRVLLVDDSPLDLVILRRLIDPMPGVDVVATAAGGKEALRLIAEHLPDVVCTDYMMPEMDGLELTKQIMGTQPTPILAISSVVDDPESAFPILQAGALDFFPKPSPTPGEEDRIRRELAQKIRVLSKVYVFRRQSRAGGSGGTATQAPREPTPSGPPIVGSTPSGARRSGHSIALIGASTGGPQALQTLLGRLPADFPLPICLAQHISPGFLDAFATWLDKTVPLSVRVARQGERPTCGCVYLAPENAHMEFGPTGLVRLSDGPKRDGHRPSITVMFESAARAFGDRSVAVLLTGMGQDGAAGMKMLSDGRALTLAQNAETSVVFGMPKAAIALGAAKHVLSPDAIADTLLEVTR